MKSFGIILTLIGCLSLYLSHPNQALVKNHLSGQFMYLGLIILVTGFFALLYVLPALVAVCMWLALLILTGSFAPFLPLFKRYMTNENK